ncbi:1-aminocyclopropane-1-carboxylate deaminase/D-cysteine desulfhydrase [Thiolapillus sp.]|nr:pyridoxal-phosphate dependent enzyme [Thiolapillus sp.]
MLPELIDLEKQFKPSTLTRIVDPRLDQFNIELWMKRDDLLHPIISGNKWRKLKFILQDVLSGGFHTVVSMGGAYSNHLHALACIGQKLDIKTIGLVRGEAPAVWNPTLRDLERWGMQLRFVSRGAYRKLREYQRPDSLPGLTPGQYWLPEGGSVKLALAGVAEAIAEIDMPYDTICVPCGTGTTLAGIIGALPARATAIGFAALKNAGFLQQDVRRFLVMPELQQPRWHIEQRYHFGGFGKSDVRLQTFIDNFIRCTGIPLEPVYTGKMLYGIYDLIERGFFRPGQRIVVLHTGGLQGSREE